MVNGAARIGAGCETGGKQALRELYTSRQQSTITRSTYNDVRRRYVLVAHHRDEGALLALLRFEGAEHPATRDNLRQLGFQPNAEPERSSISWRRRVSEDDLGPVCDAICDALGEDAVLDLGAIFADHDGEPLCLAKLPTFWPGRFLLHVGGTRRCAVFDANVDRRELARILDAERDDYYANEFIPATE